VELATRVSRIINVADKVRKRNGATAPMQATPQSPGQIARTNPASDPLHRTSLSYQSKPHSYKAARQSEASVHISLVSVIEMQIAINL
jgi:hypothetical protein